LKRATSSWNSSVTELRTAEETLEDIFVRVVGGERTTQPLAWL